MAARESNSNFVQGEASESDEEYEIDQSYFMKNTMVVKQDTTAARKGIVVEGEASESDEDEAESMPNVGEFAQNVPSQEVPKGDLADERTKRKVKFHYDSGFHRRLRVSNLELRSDAIENKMKIYNDANKKMHSALFFLNRSQAYAQDIFSNVGLISGDLQATTDTLEKILARNFLPNLKIGEDAEARTNATADLCETGGI